MSERGGFDYLGYVEASDPSVMVVPAGILAEFISEGGTGLYPFKKVGETLVHPPYPCLDSGYPMAPRIEFVDGWGMPREGRVVGVIPEEKRLVVYFASKGTSYNSQSATVLDAGVRVVFKPKNGIDRAGVILKVAERLYRQGGETKKNITGRLQ